MGQVPLKGTCLDYVIICVSVSYGQSDVFPAGDVAAHSARAKKYLFHAFYLRMVFVLVFI